MYQRQRMRQFSHILLSAFLLAAMVSILAFGVGASHAGIPLVFALIILPAAILGAIQVSEFPYSGKTRLSGTSPGFARFLRRCRNIPIATRFLIIAFVMTSLFSLELQFDIVPNAFGIVELMATVIASAIVFELSGGLFCLGLAVLFGFFTFTPPNYIAIIEFGPSFWHSLGTFVVTGLACSIYFSWLSDQLIIKRPSSGVSTLADTLFDMRLAMISPIGRLYAQLSIEAKLASLCVILYAVFWATYGTISATTGVHIDSLEAYAWGREFRFGYYKHPPFWAWIAGLWFTFVPKSDWAFYFLSELNGALGLAGAWALMGRFCDKRTRLLGVLLLMLTPFYQFNALRFNANTIFLSLWPWTMYFFVRSIERPKILQAVACGLLAGCALLSKYFAVVLIAACFFASLTHDNRRAYYASAAPYVSAVIAFAVFSPHLLWLVRDGFQPFIYLASKIELQDREISNSFFQFIGASAAFFILPLSVLVAARWRAGIPAGPMPKPANGPSFQNVVTFAPFVLTLIAGSVGHTALAIPFGIPIFALLPLSLILALRPPSDLAIKFAGAAVAAIFAGSAVAAPFIPSVFMRMGRLDNLMPRDEVADAALTAWRETVRQPLRFVSGERAYSVAVTFRSKDDTAEFNTFNFRWSPNVTPYELRTHGLLVVCGAANQTCLDLAGPYVTPNTVRREVSVPGKSARAPAVEVTLLMIPPKSAID